jgi:hypothetical protein
VSHVIAASSLHLPLYPMSSSRRNPSCRNLQYLRVTAGVKSYEVSLEKQTADIVAEPTLEYGTVLEKIKKTGKTVKGAQADGVAQDI